MFKFFCLYTIFIMNFLLTKQKKCGVYEVTNCKECDQDKCIECISGYFPTFAGLECTRCDDEQVGQVGCEGSCDGSKYSITRNVLCDKCKSGYYSLNGFCTQCSIGSPNCAKCSYEAPQGSTQKIYKCLECINNDYRVSTIDGICRTCSLPPHCLICQFVPGTNNVECLQCGNGYYPSNGECYSCYNQPNSIAGGTCYYYYCPGSSNHNTRSYCSCSSNYVLTPGQTCEICPDNCIDCRYVQNIAKCYQCNSYYALSTQNTCTHCPSNCNSCYYDQNILKCSSCEERFGLLNSQCISCGAHCRSCSFPYNNNTAICTGCTDSYILTDKQICELLSIPANCNGYQNKRFNNRDEVICTSCYSYFTLDGENNKCLSCPNYCPRCHFDTNNIFYCDSCASDYVLDANQLCEPCANNAVIGGVGCIHCKYDGRNKCTQCRNDYIFIINDYVCKLPSEINLNSTCFEAKRLDNGQYSCLKCRNNNYALINRFNSTTDCYPSENELANCVIGYEDEYQNLTCTTCLYKYRFIWSEDYQKNVLFIHLLHLNFCSVIL